MVTTTVATMVTMIATIIAFYWGKHLGNRVSVEQVIDSMLDKLEKDGYIKTKKNGLGQTELISIKDLTSGKNENESGVGFAETEESGKEEARVCRLLRKEGAHGKAALWAPVLQTLHGQVDKAGIVVPALQGCRSLIPVQGENDKC